MLWGGPPELLALWFTMRLPLYLLLTHGPKPVSLSSWRLRLSRDRRHTASGPALSSALRDDDRQHMQLPTRLYRVTLPVDLDAVVAFAVIRMASGRGVRV